LCIKTKIKYICEENEVFQSGEEFSYKLPSEASQSKTPNVEVRTEERKYVAM